MATATKTLSVNPAVNTSPFYSHQLRNFTLKGLATLFAFFIAFMYLLPIGVSVVTATQTEDQMSNGNILPMSQKTFSYQGQDLPLYYAPQPDGSTKIMAALKINKQTTFIDPSNVDAAPYVWVGFWKKLQAVQFFDAHLDNFSTAWTMANSHRCSVTR